MKLLTIVIPAYNEESFIGELLKIIVDLDLSSIGFEKEIIVVDDASKDRTFEIASGFSGVKVVRLESNQGKGAAVSRGISLSCGEFVIIQDADLEYSPFEYSTMLNVINMNPNSKVSVYGSRLLGQIANNGKLSFGKHKDQDFLPWLAGIVLSFWCLLLFGVLITDTLTAYKIYEGNFIRGLNLKTSGFETDHEITAKLIRNGYNILEVPISYSPRTVEEGKKIKAIDGVKAITTFFRFRFFN